MEPVCEYPDFKYAEYPDYFLILNYRFRPY